MRLKLFYDDEINIISTTNNIILYLGCHLYRKQTIKIKNYLRIYVFTQEVPNNKHIILILMLLKIKLSLYAHNIHNNS